MQSKYTSQSNFGETTVLVPEHKRTSLLMREAPEILRPCKLTYNNEKPNYRCEQTCEKLD